MGVSIIDGKASADRLTAQVAARVGVFRDRQGFAPQLAVVLVGDDPASATYVAAKGRQAAFAGLRSREHRLGADARLADLLALIAALNQDDAVHGILVQLPLPASIDPAAVIAAIDPAKDVDGFHPVNQGSLLTGAPGFVPCTPLGCMMLLREVHGSLAGLHAVVLGRSTIVGRPMAALLLNADCTVTITHSRTRDVAAHARQADILVAAIGKPQIVRADWIKPGATVIDVGINRVTEPGDGGTPRRRLVGDVAFDEALAVAGAITPVPGGVGPMTVACLLSNTLAAACRRVGISPDALTP